MYLGRHGNIGSSPRSPTGPLALPRRWFAHKASYRAPGIGSIWPDFGLIVKCRRQLSRRFGRGTKSDAVVLLLTQSPLGPKRWPACRDLVAPRRQGGVSTVHPPGRLVAATWSLLMVNGSQEARTKQDKIRRSPGCAFELSNTSCPRRRIDHIKSSSGTASRKEHNARCGLSTPSGGWESGTGRPSLQSAGPGRQGDRVRESGPGSKWRTN